MSLIRPETAVPASPDQRSDAVPLGLALAGSAADAWNDLAAAAIERSVFSEAAMARAAAGTVEPGDWVAVRCFTGDRLDGLVLVRHGRAVPIVGPPLLDAFHSHYGPRNPPLLRAGVDDAADRLLAAAADLGALVRLRNQALDGPAVAALSQAAGRRGGGVIVVDEHRRALLEADAGPDVAFGPALAGRRRKELDRQLRRLGSVDHRTAVDAGTVEEAFDTFLELERMGWKGDAGTSLADDGRRLAFARSLVGTLAGEGRARIDTLSAAGRSIAALVTLLAGDTAFLWKIAHDPDFASASPGVQVVRAAGAGFLADPAIRSVDSLATPDHPMIDRVFAGRIRIGTLVVALTEETLHTARRAADLHARAGSLRTRLRDVVRRVTG
jgi:CelD/BcsL family acetyltransferase involved in cellulose biosynthesis